MPIKPLPPFHDDSLIGIIVLNDECILLISDQNGRIRELVLSGDLRLRADQFMEGNTILDLIVVSPDHASEKDILFALSMDEVGMYGPFVEKTLQRVKSGELLLVQMSSSYGCTLTALCMDVRLDANVVRRTLQGLGDSN